MKRYGDALITQAQLTGPNLVAHGLCEMGTHATHSTRPRALRLN